MRSKLASCLGKSGFSTWARARAVAQRMRRTGQEARWAAAYKCEFCPSYHVGGESVPLPLRDRNRAALRRRRIEQAEEAAIAELEREVKDGD